MKYYAVIDTNVIVSAVMAFNKSNEESSPYIILANVLAGRVIQKKDLIPQSIRFNSVLIFLWNSFINRFLPVIFNIIKKISVIVNSKRI